MDTEKLNEDITQLKDELESIALTKIDLVKIQLSKNISKLASSLTSIIILFYLSSLVLFFASISLALKMGESMGYINGFLIISGAYAILGIIFIIIKKKIIDTPIITSVMEAFFPQKKEDGKE